MLQRIAPTLFQGTTGETVTIAAVAQSNNGVEAATFRYGTTQLTPRQVQGHPGCEFNVVPGTNTCGAVVVFDPASPNARYELFEEDDNGILQPLQIVARPLSGPIVQFQIAAIPAAVPLPLPPPPAPAPTAAAPAVPVLAPAPAGAPESAPVAKGVAKKAAKKAAKKTAKTTVKKAAAKAAKKASKKTAKKSVKTATKTSKRAVKKAAKKVAKGVKTAKKSGKRRPR